jgi:hypothetical protein
MRRGVILASLVVAVACQPGLPTNEASSGSSTSEVAEDTSEASEGSELTDTETESETGSEGPPPCEPAMLDTCWSQSNEKLAACLDTCTCDGSCAADCHNAAKDRRWDCFDQYCLEPWDERCDAVCYSTDSCQDFCDARRSSCSNVDGCGTHMCDYQWRGCLDSCWACVNVEFEFAYADSCELVLPGPPVGVSGPFVSIRIGGQEWWISEPGSSCGDLEASDVVWADENSDRLLLCNRACEAFAMLGVAEVEHGCPPG